MACKNKKNHKGFAKENIFRGYYLQTVIKNEKKVNSRCKLEELCYNDFENARNVDFSAFLAFFATNLLLVQSKIEQNHFNNRIVSRNS